MADIYKFKEALYRGQFPTDHLSSIYKSIEGMCDLATLAMLNFAVSHCMEDNEQYLEIGTWKGRTVISALQQNDRLATVIDPLTFDDSSTAFYRNIQQCGVDDRINMHQMPWESFKPDDDFDRIGVFLYDGDHGLESSYNGLNGFLPFLSDEAIIVVDDLVMRPVRRDMYRWLHEHDSIIQFYYETDSWMQQAVIGINKES